MHGYLKVFQHYPDKAGGEERDVFFYGRVKGRRNRSYTVGLYPDKECDGTPEILQTGSTSGDNNQFRVALTSLDAESYTLLDESGDDGRLNLIDEYMGIAEDDEV